MTEPTLPPEPAKDATADELEADIAATRQQLGETIDALEDKLNVSAQAKRKVDAVRTQLVDKVGHTRTQVTDQVGHTKAQVTDKMAQAKAKVTRRKGGPSTESARDPGYVADMVYPAEAGAEDSSLGSTRAASAFTGGSVGGWLGQAKADLSGRAGRFTARTRQDPRSALPVAAAALGGVVVVWLARRATRRPDPVLEQE